MSWHPPQERPLEGQIVVGMVVLDGHGGYALLCNKFGRWVHELTNTEFPGRVMGWMEIPPFAIEEQFELEP